jgi:hypothetical protein
MINENEAEAIIENGGSIPTIPSRRRVVGGAKLESGSFLNAGFRFYQLESESRQSPPTATSTSLSTEGGTGWERRRSTPTISERNTKPRPSPIHRAASIRGGSIEPTPAIAPGATAKGKAMRAMIEEDRE